MRFSIPAGDDLSPVEGAAAARVDGDGDWQPLNLDAPTTGAGSTVILFALPGDIRARSSASA